MAKLRRFAGRGMPWRRQDLWTARPSKFHPAATGNHPRLLQHHQADFFGVAGDRSFSGPYIGSIRFLRVPALRNARVCCIADRVHHYVYFTSDSLSSYATSSRLPQRLLLNELHRRPQSCPLGIDVCDFLVPSVGSFSFHHAFTMRAASLLLVSHLTL